MTNLRVYADELELNKNELLELENCSLKIRFIEDFLFRDINEFRNCNLNISVGLSETNESDKPSSGQSSPQTNSILHLFLH